MKVFILFFTLFILSTTSFGALSCKNLLEQNQTSLLIEENGLLSRTMNPLHPNGSLSSYLIVYKGQQQESATRKSQSLLLERIQIERPDLFESRASLIVIDILGERKGFLRTLSEQIVNNLSGDLIGVNTFIVNTGAEISAVNKVALVIDAEVKDFSQGAAKTLKHDEAINRILDSLHGEITNLFSFVDLEAHSFDFNEKAYAALQEFSSRTNKPLRESKGELHRLYKMALRSYLSSMPGDHIFYLQPSLFDENPQASTRITELYALSQQVKDSRHFEETFSGKAKEIKERIFRTMLNRRHGRSNGDSALSYEGSEGRINNTSLINSVPLLSESTLPKQMDLGADFDPLYRPEELEFRNLRFSAGSNLAAAVKQVKKFGVEGLEDLRFKSADEMIERYHLSKDQLSALALEASEYGIYFTYSNFLLLRMDPLTRRRVRPPMGRSFDYSPMQNNYRPKFDSEEGN